MTCKDCIRYQSGRCSKSDEDNEVCGSFVGKQVTDMEYTLKPCPFCGKSVAEFASLKEMEDCKHFEDDTCPAYEIEECSGIRIICNVLKGGCGASTGYSFNKDNAVAMWNRRCSG